MVLLRFLNAIKMLNKIRMYIATARQSRIVGAHRILEVFVMVVEQHVARVLVLVGAGLLHLVNQRWRTTAEHSEDVRLYNARRTRNVLRAI